MSALFYRSNPILTKVLQELPEETAQQMLEEHNLLLGCQPVRNTAAYLLTEVARTFHSEESSIFITCIDRLDAYRVFGLFPQTVTNEPALEEYMQYSITSDLLIARELGLPLMLQWLGDRANHFRAYATALQARYELIEQLIDGVS